ncbi:MAG: DUF3592 domain-containing protein [Acidimicrobiia bacterium]
MNIPKRWARFATWSAIVVRIPVALVMLGTGIADYESAGKLDERGAEVPAEVVHVTVNTGGEDGPTSTLTIRFKPRGDDPTKTMTNVSYDGDFEHDHPRADRQGIRIEYDPENPEHARVVGQSGDALDRMIGGAVFTRVIVAFAIVSRRRPDLLGG